jgi:hypothetical protein
MTEPVALFDGLTLLQQRAVHAAFKAAPAAWCEGMWRLLHGVLGSTPPWTNAQVSTAISAAFELAGLPPTMVAPDRDTPYPIIFAVNSNLSATADVVPA